MSLSIFMMMYFYIAMVLSLVFMFVKSPLFMGVIILIESLIISLSMYFIMSSSWFSYILLMIFISGMMIIFIYVCSLVSNILINLNFSIIFIIIVSVFFIYMMYMVVGVELFSYNKSGLIQGLIYMDYPILYKMYSWWVSSMSMVLMVYLLVVLFVVVKNVYISKGPLQLKF